MNRCTLPPPGWICTRKPGHRNPCAAHPEAEFYRQALERIANMPEHPIWMDDRDDAADMMVDIACAALVR